MQQCYFGGAQEGLEPTFSVAIYVAKEAPQSSKLILLYSVLVWIKSDAWCVCIKGHCRPRNHHSDYDTKDCVNSKHPFHNHTSPWGFQKVQYYDMCKHKYPGVYHYRNLRWNEFLQYSVLVNFPWICIFIKVETSRLFSQYYFPIDIQFLCLSLSIKDSLHLYFQCRNAFLSVSFSYLYTHFLCPDWILAPICSPFILSRSHVQDGETINMLWCTSIVKHMSLDTGP